MTEPVRQSSLESLSRRVCATLLAVSLASLSPLGVWAAPPEEAPATDEAPAEVPDEAAIQAALADGDLTTARDMAVARSAAEPSADNLVLEARVWTALGDYEQAKRAYGSARDALPEGAVEQRESIEAELQALEDQSRGTRADEPVSTQRERLDAERAERLAALSAKPPPPTITDAAKPVPITKKWYFWVTLGAIAASAGAIVGLAVSSAVEERRDTGTAARQPIPVGGVTLRF